MRSKRIDLHTHSAASDGSDSPTELIEAAIQNGIGVIALTDHDTIAGIEEAFRAAQGYPLLLIQGVELSTHYAGREMHLLGYGVESTCSFRHFLNSMIESRDSRNLKMIDKFRGLGIELSMKEISAKAGGEVVSRPHFAQVLYEKGFVSSRQEAFDHYLAEGASCYVARASAPYQDCLKAILQAGGVPVLAHPFLLESSPLALRKILLELKTAGLQGLEVWHSDHPQDMQKIYAGFAEELELLPTGGSDYHGRNKPHIELGRGFKNNVLLNDFKIVERLLEQIQKNQNQ